MSLCHSAGTMLHGDHGAREMRQWAFRDSDTRAAGLNANPLRGSGKTTALGQGNPRRYRISRQRGGRWGWSRCHAASAEAYLGHRARIRHTPDCNRGDSGLDRPGSRVRITGQSVDAATGTRLWADRFDGSLEDVFELQDHVTASVVAVIEPNLRAAWIACARRKPVENLQAYDLMPRALPHCYTRTRDSPEEAARLLRRAIEIDPTHALAVAHVASCYWISMSQNWMERSNPAFNEMVHLARTAIAPDGDDPDVLWVTSQIVALGDRGPHGAIASLNKAPGLNPNSADATGWLGVLTAYTGDTQSAIAHLEHSFRLNPLGHAAVFYRGMLSRILWRATLLSGQ